MDDEDTVMQRIDLALLFHQSRCVLHLWSLLSLNSVEQDSDSESHSNCLDAAFKILEYQSLLDQETRIGGRFVMNRSMKSSALTSNSSFLLATSILCLELDHYITNMTNEQSFSLTELQRLSTDDVPSTTQRVVKTLKDSYFMWSQSITNTSQGQSPNQDVLKITTALQIILTKAQDLGLMREEATPQSAHPPMTADSNPFSGPLPPTGPSSSSISESMSPPPRPQSQLQPENTMTIPFPIPPDSLTNGSPAQAHINRLLAQQGTPGLQPTSIPQLLGSNSKVVIDYTGIWRDGERGIRAGGGRGSGNGGGERN